MKLNNWNSDCLWAYACVTKDNSFKKFHQLNNFAAIDKIDKIEIVSKYKSMNTCNIDIKVPPKIPIT